MALMPTASATRWQRTPGFRIAHRRCERARQARLRSGDADPRRPHPGAGALQRAVERGQSPDPRRAVVGRFTDPGAGAAGLAPVATAAAATHPGHRTGDRADRGRQPRPAPAAVQPAR
ncbi:hypothetical protein G6F32_016156 [Rhizopus arrhizus]|nr:hypothetical protein G6F32_016156 [Rhizopus arrhizus]